MLESHARVKELADEWAGNRANRNNEAARIELMVCLFPGRFMTENNFNQSSFISQQEKIAINHG